MTTGNEISAIRQAILDAVWGENYFGTERTVDNFITRLRQKLDDVDDPRHFLTARGMGLRSNRYSMLVKNGKVVTLNIEGPGKFEVSDADTMLAQAKG